MQESQKKFNEFAKEQERLFLEFVSIHHRLNDFIRSVNNETKELIENGNKIEESFGLNRGLFGRNMEGNGFFHLHGKTTHQYFHLYTREIIEAQELFNKRVLDKHQKLFGHFQVFHPLQLDFEYFYNGNVFSLSDILKWIEEEKSGESIQNYFARYESFEQKGTKVSFKDHSWDKDDYGGIDAYSPYDYHPLFGALHFVEFGHTHYKDFYGELQNELGDTTIERLKKPFLIESSNLVDNIRFYLNGKVEITFKTKGDAENFFSFITGKQKIAK